MRAGDRVRLISTLDPYTRLAPGEQGVVTLVDGLGAGHVAWDSGSNVGLIPGEDKWEIILEKLIDNRAIITG